MEKAIRAKEVASKTGLPVWAVRKYVRDGVISGVQIGGKGTALWIMEDEADKLCALLKGQR